MLRRVVLVAALAAAAVIVPSAQASAGSSDAAATAVRTSTQYAWGDWITGHVPNGNGGETSNEAGIRLDVDSDTGPLLDGIFCQWEHQGSEAITGGGCTSFTDVTTGFTYSFGPNFSSATVHAVDLPGRRCDWDPDVNSPSGNCRATTITLDVTWTGADVKVSRDTSVSSTPGSSRTSRTLSFRFAPASAVVDGVAIGSGRGELGSIVTQSVNR